MFESQYDVIVVGAGHAGSEAAAAAANMGCSTLLITMNLQNIAQMSCNPAMGGIAKGQIVREIDALGGYSGIVSDTSAIQFKMLNKSKGPAMWSPRVQSDRMRFAEDWRLKLEQTPNLDFYQEMVAGLIVEKDKLVGVRTSLGLEVRGKTVVLCKRETNLCKSRFLRQRKNSASSTTLALCEEFFSRGRRMWPQARKSADPARRAGR